MRNIIDYLMNPTFSEPFTNFFYGFGEAFGVVLLGTIKMVLIFTGSLLLISPLIPFIFYAAKRYLNTGSEK